jgi:hypothetical protein
MTAISAMRRTARFYLEYIHDMKRVALLAMSLLAALPALAIRTEPRAVRICVLAERADGVPALLRSALVARGADAFSQRGSIREAERGEAPDADYYVEIVDPREDSSAAAGAGVGMGRTSIEVAALVGHASAEIRLYDARTLTLIDSCRLERESAMLAPTAIGFGGRSLFAWRPLPLPRHRARGAARAVASEAAERILRNAR